MLSFDFWYIFLFILSKCNIIVGINKKKQGNKNIALQ